MRLEFSGGHKVGRQQDGASTRRRAGHDLPRGVVHLGLLQAFAHIHPLGRQKRIGHGAANDQHIHLG